ncbi:MAG: phosphoadenosine phosphosulfate reductase family protein [Dysgonamonadaceae bacterium]|nr:phosphoadenosine phosphosulfate reductase family protein [Dysgonamonadaceae bacterium]
MNLFFEQYEQQAIERIQKFAALASRMGFRPALGFSGGKDSQVCYDLCKRAGIDFDAYFNVSFESNITKKFIREYYPDVIFRKDYKFGFIQNISVNHSCLLPTKEIDYCCKDYKHNPRYVDAASIVGVRKAESAARKTRTVLSVKNKSNLKKNKQLYGEYFRAGCQSTGTQSEIQLMPVVDFSDDEIWDYIKKYNLPVNPEYKMGRKRIGCIVCPKTNFSSNLNGLYRYPKLIDAFIRVRERGTVDWIIRNDNKDYSDDKVYYICRWLNRSFRKFSKRQEREYQEFRTFYDNYKRK